ncbi:M48 family metalloprotease [Methanoculleus horonobensis]|uniref:M48 family metalloprotease n=1 Tax=Methanoculleus horonobensis TaxID=528314 RepID=UPI001F4185F8|nr:M48 family metalloprotease [Methanoculleus horonobensis]MDD4252903.1 M48 family metalloprotease [Methanoculleus horonobensis]
MIDRRTKLVRCPFTISIRGCPALNSIRYRHSFYERNLSEASDDTLRFVLLHEEGHVRKGSSLLSALPTLPVLLCLAFFGHPPLLIGGLPAAKPVFIALLLLIAFLAYRTYYHRMCDEEFIADRYAADAMRCCYRVRDPGTLLQNVLSGLLTGASSPHRKGVIPGLLRSEPDYRPSIADRVQKLRAATDPGNRRPVRPTDGDRSS